MARKKADKNNSSVETTVREQKAPVLPTKPTSEIEVDVPIKTAPVESNATPEDYNFPYEHTDPSQQPTSDNLPRQKLLAPSPIIDRFPIIIGQGLNLAYISSTLRMCNTGIRYLFVDVLNELLEHDPHARGVIRQRIISVAGARLVVEPAALPPNDKNFSKAQEIADEVKRQLDNLPAKSQAMGALTWGVIYGVSGAEIEWDITEGVWEAKRLHFIHNRRLNYSNPTTWDIHIWDQGLVGPGLQYLGATNGVYGLRIKDYPGKFIIHTPQLNADYPTRDGEGRYVAFYIALKRMIVRASAMDFERTIRPWVVGYFNREIERGDKSIAGQEDINQLNAALKAFGTGSLNAAALPDSVNVEIIKRASEGSAENFVKWIDEQLTKALLGQTYTTSPGSRGTHQAAQTADKSTLKIARYDAACLSDTLERDLVYWIVKLNFPGFENKLCPRLRIVVEEVPDAVQLAELARVLTAIDVPIDVDELGAMTGMPVVAADDQIARRTREVAAGKFGGPVEPTDETDPNDPDYEGPPASEVAQPKNGDKNSPTEPPDAAKPAKAKNK